MIKAKKDYYSLRNLFNDCEVENGNYVATFCSDKFVFKIGGKYTLKIGLFVLGEENIEVSVLFIIKSQNDAKIIEGKRNNQIVLNNSTINVDKSVNVNCAEKTIGKKIKIARENDRTYVESVINNGDKSFVIEIANKTTENSDEYQNMNIRNIDIMSNFNIEISTENELPFFRKFGEKESIKQAVYKAFYEKDLYFLLCYIIKFDSEILYKIDIEPMDFASILTLVNLYLLAYKYHGLTAIDTVTFLVNKAEKYSLNGDIKEIDLSLDFLEKIDKSSSVYKRICNNLKDRLIKYLHKVRVDILFSKLLETGDTSIILLFAKHKKLLQLEYEIKFEEYLENVDFFDLNYAKSKYYECLYYLYDENNKNKIFKAINDEEIDIAKIAIVTDKIMGLDLVDGLISFSPILPFSLDKVAMNVITGARTITCIAKRGFDYFAINGKEYEKNRKVLLKGKTVKIVASAR